MTAPGNVTGEKLAFDYLARLTQAALRYLPKGDRIKFVSSTRALIERQCGPLAQADVSRVAAVLAELGEPQELVRLERARLDAAWAKRRAAASVPGSAAPPWEQRPLTSRWRPATADRLRPGARFPRRRARGGPGYPGPGPGVAGPEDAVSPPVTRDAGPGSAGTGGAVPGSAGVGPAGSAGPGSAGPGSAGPGSAGPGSAGPGSAGPGSAGPGSAGPGSAGPGSAGPGSAGTGGAGAGPAGGAGAGRRAPESAAAGPVPAGGPGHPRAAGAPRAGRSSGGRPGARVLTALAELAGLARRYPREAVAVLLLGVGGLLLPLPFWPLGAAVTGLSRFWEARYRWVSLYGPLLVFLAGTALVAVAAGGHGGFFHVYVHLLGTDARYLVRLGCLGTAVFLAWLVRRGPRERVPPWRR